MNKIICNSTIELIENFNNDIHLEVINERLNIDDVLTKSNKIIIKDKENIHISRNQDKECYIYLGNKEIIFKDCKNINIDNFIIIKSMNDDENIIFENCTDITLNINIDSWDNELMTLINCNRFFITCDRTEGELKLINCNNIFSDISKNSYMTGIRSSIESGIKTFKPLIGKGKRNLENINLKYGKKIIYNSNWKRIMIIDKKNQYTSNALSSRPILSPNEKNILFICPQEFEAIGELYLYNFSKHTCEIILDSRELGNQITIKKAFWKNNNEIYLICGMAYGTVSIGGNLYKFDIETRKINKIYECELRTEVIDIEKIDYDKLTIKIAEFDEALNNHEVYFKEICENI